MTLGTRKNTGRPAGNLREVWHTTCCVIGCGPAGAMLGLMLAREGVDVLVLEKHADFLRDFRGDTLHPSTMQIMDELGLADGLLDLRHTKARKIKARLPGRTVAVADLGHLKTRFPYVTFMPQWDFLDYVTGEAKRYPNFRLETNAEAKDLILESGIVRGVRYETPEGPREARALLTVSADGRSSPFREQAGLKMVRTSPPIDVLWFRLSRREGDPEGTFGYAGNSRFMAVINRSEYWQIAYVIRKGEYESVRAEGLEAFRRSVGEAIPEFADRTGELRDWDDVKLLTVQSDRLRRWHRPGLLCIGDAAHAMSPVGGVGINLAIADAVAAANTLAGPLKAGRVSWRDLMAVQLRRELPTRVIQALQSFAQRRVISSSLQQGGAPSLPAPARVLLSLRPVRGIPARIIAFGIWPEHVKSRRAIVRTGQTPGARKESVK
ncbi:MAG TPA: FAD-dependent oxidoreductase [Rubrobacter sp.]|nr:FAD-dependent oxidoreductase [Rubrobacter sp.]